MFVSGMEKYDERLLENRMITESSVIGTIYKDCLLYTSPSPRDGLLSRMPSSA